MEGIFETKNKNNAGKHHADKSIHYNGQQVRQARQSGTLLLPVQCN